MRRRSKPRVVWLPPDPYGRLAIDTPLTSGDQTAIGYHTFHALSSKDPGDYEGAAIALTGDGGNANTRIIGLSPPEGGTSFADLFNSGYRLRRICGSIFCTTSQDGQNGIAGSVYITAAFQVMRVDASGLPVDVTAAQPDTYENQENPWIWRRTWVITNEASNLGLQKPLGLRNNASYGSVREGTHVDQKTSRIIGVDERLFMCVTVTYDSSQDQSLDCFHTIAWNLRFLASLKSNVGNRRNSSR